MSPDLTLTIANDLDDRRERMIDRVAELLAQSLPMVGIDPGRSDRWSLHQQRMRSTAQRFHEMILFGATADWGLVEYEYSWTTRVLTRLGITWDHQQALIDAYFSAARDARPWQPDELAILDQLAARVRELGARAYATP